MKRCDGRAGLATSLARPSGVQRACVGGAFSTVGSAPALAAAGFARWDGTGWSPAGSGLGNNRVSALEVHDDAIGFGPWLAVGGTFTSVPGTLPAAGSRLAFWNGGWEGVDDWTVLGFALPGVAGDPLFVGSGPFTCGSVNTLQLTQAAPAALAGLFLSCSSSPVPFAGGTLVGFTFLGPFLFTTGPTGVIGISFVLEARLPPGTEMFSQWAIADAAAVAGYSLSNALRGDVP